MQKYSHLPQLEVGILFSPEICFRLNGIFTCRTTGKKYTGAYNIRQTEDGYLLSQADHRRTKTPDSDKYPFFGRLSTQCDIF